MRLGTPFSGLKPSSGVLLWLLIHGTTSVLAGVIPEEHHSTFAKRNPADLIEGILNQISNAIPSMSSMGSYLYESLLEATSDDPYTITQKSTSSFWRWANLALVRSTFWYGPPVGGGPAYPSGPLGAAKDAKDLISLNLDVIPELANTVLDLAKAVADTPKYNNLKTLDDYTKLYNDEWKRVLPGGPDPGVETNYTQDLLFSMQRLTNSPYQIRRLNPALISDIPPFSIPDNTSTAITGTTLTNLYQQGRLFYADYRDQGKIPLANNRYAAACDAYFFIHPQSGDFLPLAIRTNVGANLVYTPLDSPGDWLLAKMMYSINDFWFAQWNHLAGVHETVHIIWMAAIRSLSQEHPVYAVLNRLTYQVFAIQVLAKVVLFSPLIVVDQIFPFSGESAEKYSTEQYFNGAGKFQANYFLTNLRNRGLINNTYGGPALKSFPFYQDASVIHDAIRGFMTTFIKSYYASDADVLADSEIQDWVKEARGPAKVFDFPERIDSVDGLVGVLTQMAHLVSSAHHTVNTNELLGVSSTLPFCPPALYKPLPTTKSNATNPVDYLPPLDKAFEQIVVGALFARPLFVGTNRTIIHMFDEDSMLERMNKATREANGVFIQRMREFSGVVRGRGFDEAGLSLGMPFVWRALDPNVAPFSVST